jgi:DNA modification methylase
VSKSGSGSVGKLEQVPTSDLIPYARTARTHSDAQVAQIAGSIQEFGFCNPVLIDGQNGIIAGHGRVMAANLLKLQTVPCIRLDHLTDAQKRAYILADNRIALSSGWDEAMLANELQDLHADEIDLGLTGFDADELSKMLGLEELDNEKNGEVVEDEVPEPPADPITKPGSLWILGEHRLLCGDSTKAEDVERLMAGAKANLCFTSPPYGQQRDYTAEGKAKVADWDGLMRGVFANLPMTDAGQVLVNLGLIHREGEWIPYWDKWIEWMREQGWRRFGWYVWDKKHPMPMKDSGRLLPQHEWVFHFNRKHIDCNKTIPCVSAGRETGYGLRATDGILNDAGRDVTRSHRVLGSVIYAAANAGGSQDHPAVMSLDLPKQFIGLWEGSLYEPFCGSGTTLIAAEQLGRKCYGMEISPQYCDVIVKRWETLTGKTATLEAHHDRNHTAD